MAVYRPAPQVLEVQLNSIIAQTEKDWVCHIGIDGADDETRLRVELATAGDPRFVVHAYEGNVGFFRNFERTIAEARGAVWVALADQDDYWFPEKLATQLAHLQGDVVAVSGQARLVDGAGHELGFTHRRDTTIEALAIDNQVTGAMSVFRGDVVELSLPFPAPTDAAYHDHWLALCARSLGQIKFLETPLQDYVQHGNNVLGESGHSAPLSRRIRKLRAAHGSTLEHLADHRWGWRHDMVNTLATRAADLPDGLQPFRKPGVSLALMALVLRVLVQREAPVARTLGLLAGACYARLRAWRERNGGEPGFSKRRPTAPRRAGSSRG